MIIRDANNKKVAKIWCCVDEYKQIYLRSTW